jgi:hypothetical protein
MTSRRKSFEVTRPRSGGRLKKRPLTTGSMGPHAQCTHVLARSGSGNDAGGKVCLSQQVLNWSAGAAVSAAVTQWANPVGGKVPVNIFK